MNPKYFRCVPFMKRRDGKVYTSDKKLVDETALKLNDVCFASPILGHCWLVYPDWSVPVVESGQRYILCLNCGRKSNL